MKTAVFLAVLAVFAATQASALSCRPFTVTDAFLEADHSRSDFVIVTGRLDFDKSLLPVVDMDRQQDTPPETDIPAVLTGRSLSRNGFVRPFSEEINLEVRCYGPWCASATSGAEYLAFLEKTRDGYVLSVNPCGGYGFAPVTREMKKQVTDCLNGLDCTPSGS